MYHTFFSFPKIYPLRHKRPYNAFLMVENNVTELFGVSFNYKQVTELAHCNYMATEFG